MKLPGESPGTSRQEQEIPETLNPRSLPVLFSVFMHTALGCCCWRALAILRTRRPCLETSFHLPSFRVSGIWRTSATNFANRGEVLSFRQTRENGKGRFKSATG